MSTETKPYFTVQDFLQGFKFGYFLDLIDDVKISDGSAKTIQYFLKLAAALLREGFLNVDPASSKVQPESLAWSKAFDGAAGQISLARRCFRFIRWLRSVDDLPKVLKTDGTSFIGILKRLNWCGSMTAMIVEDITTLGRLGLVDKNKTEAWSLLGNWGWFVESVTGLVIQLQVVNQALNDLNAARQALRNANGDDIQPLVRRAYIAHTKYLLAQILLVKWISESTASSHDLGYHNYTKTSMLLSMISAMCTVQLQAAKFWPGRKAYQEK